MEYHSMLLKADSSCLLVIDVQSKLATAMHDRNAMVGNVQRLMRAAARLKVPTLVSEQYPRGLGPTVDELAAEVSSATVLEKVHFSCMADDAYAAKFNDLGRSQVVVCGIEAHVCVLQTTLDLIEQGRRVYVATDATSSRTPRNATAGWDRMRAAGAEIVTTEMVLFEWLERAGTPEFKDLSPLIK